MLISLLIENFRSFGDEQELSAVANGKHQNLTEHLVEIPGHDEKLVPVIALYGPNGAGKSNVVHALSWLWRQLASPNEYIGRRPHMYFERSTPSRFVMRFLAGKDVYEFGATLSDDHYESEWLTVVGPTGTERTVYERETDAGGKTHVEFGRLLESSSEKLNALRVVGARSGELFLSRIQHDLTAEELPELLRAPLRWMARLVIVQPDAPYVTLGSRMYRDPEFSSLVSELMRKMGTGVERVVSDVRGRFAVEELSAVEREAFDRFPEGGSFALRGRDQLVKLDDESFGRLQMSAVHVNSKGRVESLPFEAESDGTKRIAHLAPALFEPAQEPCVFVVDELDRSLHPVLVREFIREFVHRARGTRSQLIFTAHETYALDQDLLRRDEIWLVEKNKDGASELYSLDDFPVRTDLKLDRSYLQGRFGAVPNLRSP